MPERYCFIENCRSEFPQFLVPKDKVKRNKFLEILGATNCHEVEVKARKKVPSLSGCPIVAKYGNFTESKLFSYE